MEEKLDMGTPWYLVCWEPTEFEQNPTDSWEPISHVAACASWQGFNKKTQNHLRKNVPFMIKLLQQEMNGPQIKKYLLEIVRKPNDMQTLQCLRDIFYIPSP